MPTLRVVAQNVCGQPADFILEGYERKAKEEGDDVVIFSVEDIFHRVVKIEQPSVPPGHWVMKEAEIDYDLRPLQWTTPSGMEGRFLLRELSWGEHSLIVEAGLLD